MNHSVGDWHSFGRRPLGLQLDSRAADTVATVAMALLWPTPAALCSCCDTDWMGRDEVMEAVKVVMLLARGPAADGRREEQQ
jgi:hypothetical protein